MNAITIVLRSGMGMLLDSVRPYLRPGMPIAIGRGGAVIAEAAEGNAIEDKHQAAEAVVAGLENTLLNIERHAEAGQNGSALQAMDALRRIRELTAAFLDNSGARAERGSPASGAAAEPAYPGAAAARRPVNPGEQPHSAPVVPLKPSIFDVITGTAGATGDGSGAQLPPLDEHLAQVEQVAAGLREDQAELAESILVLEDWLERVEIEDGYVGVPVIEAVEMVVTELKRQQQPVDPAFCRCNHWFAGDSVEAAFIREHGQCKDCVEMDQILEQEVQAENAKRYLWLRNTALYASDLAREVNRMDKSVVNLLPRDKDGNLLANAELDEAIDAAMAKWSAEVLCAGVDVATDRVELAIHNWTAPAEGGDA